MWEGGVFCHKLIRGMQLLAQHHSSVLFLCSAVTVINIVSLVRNCELLKRALPFLPWFTQLAFRAEPCWGWGEEALPSPLKFVGRLPTIQKSPHLQMLKLFMVRDLCLAVHTCTHRHTNTMHTETESVSDTEHNPSCCQIKQLHRGKEQLARQTRSPFFHTYFLRIVFILADLLPHVQILMLCFTVGSICCSVPQRFCTFTTVLELYTLKNSLRFCC